MPKFKLSEHRVNREQLRVSLFHWKWNGLNAHDFIPGHNQNDLLGLSQEVSVLHRFIFVPFLIETCHISISQHMVCCTYEICSCML